MSSYWSYYSFHWILTILFNSAPIYTTSIGTIDRDKNLQKYKRIALPYGVNLHISEFIIRYMFIIWDYQLKLA